MSTESSLRETVVGVGLMGTGRRHTCFSQRVRGDVAIIAKFAPGAAVTVAHRAKTIAVLWQWPPRRKWCDNKSFISESPILVPTPLLLQMVECYLAMRPTTLKAWCEY